jgi:glycerol-3-phosphate dehydrogenase (NAD(P)+)
LSNSKKPKVGILGSGSFATALVKIFSDNGTIEIFWWIKKPELANQVQKLHHNPKYLSSVPISLPDEHISSDLVKIVNICDWILLAIPAAFLQKELIVLSSKSFRGKKIITVIKGMIPEENLVVAEFMNRFYDVEIKNIVVVTGPCHAEEIAQEKLSYLTMASVKPQESDLVCSYFNTSYVKTQTSNDLYGVELASVLKNIMSLASGIFRGLGYGDNFQAVFISCALREMESFLNKLYPINRNIMESAYLGDLLVTAYSQFSRNRNFGTMVGKGYSVKSASLEMNMIAEGYFASASIQYLIETHHLKMPILETVYRILYLGSNPGTEMLNLTASLH